MKEIACPLLLVAAGLFGPAPVDPCAELSELSAKRTALVRQYEAEWKKQGQPPAELWQRIQSLAAQLRQIIFRVLREAEAGHQEIGESCCAEQSKVPVLRWVCAMTTYLRDRDAARLVKTMPADRQGIAFLWEMDAILGSVPPDRPAEAPQVLLKRSFADYVIDRIYEVVLQGDDLALSRFLSLMVQADGSYAEYLQERFAQLIIEHPRVVLTRWPTIRKFATRLHVGTTTFTSSLDDVLQQYRSECKRLGTPPRDCQEVLRFLKRLAAE